jgi:nucleotide-binding universal stress UspA family protein
LDFSGGFNEEEMKLFDDARRRCEERLVTLSRDLQGCNVKIETAHRLGTPYEETIKVARERGVVLIIIATHGYTGLEHFLLGCQHRSEKRINSPI